MAIPLSLLTQKKVGTPAEQVQEQVQNTQRTLPSGQTYRVTEAGTPYGKNINTAAYRLAQQRGLSNPIQYATGTPLPTETITPAIQPQEQQYQMPVEQTPSYQQPTAMSQYEQQGGYTNQDLMAGLNMLAQAKYGSPYGAQADILNLLDQAAAQRYAGTGIYGTPQGYAFSPDQLRGMQNANDALIQARAQQLGAAAQEASSQQTGNKLGSTTMNDAQFKVYNNLADSFNTISATDRKKVLEYNSIKQLAQNAKKGSPQANIAIVYSFMRSLDPTSTVREGEYATAQNSAGIPDNVRNLFNKAINGNFLTPSQIDGFTQQAKTLADTADKNLQVYAKDFAKRANLGGVPVSESDFYVPEMYIVGDNTSTSAGSVGQERIGGLF